MDSHEDFTFNIHIADDNRTLVQVDHFSYRENAITFLLGESGIGKTLISKAVYGILDPQELTVRVNNAPYSQYLASSRVKTIQRNSFFVFQEPSSHLNPLMKLNSQLREGGIAGDLEEDAILKTLWDRPEESAYRSILDIYPKPYRPSGGEKQRILIAMAFKKINLFFKKYHGASLNLFLFDEPSGSLDDYFRNIFMEHLISLYRKRPFTILLITHDYSMIGHMETKYADLKKHICYKELILEKNQPVLKDFSPERYTDWIRKEEKARTRKSADGETVLKLRSGYRIFGRRFSILKNNRETDLEIRKGEMVYIKAPSGVGKTTLAKIIAGLIPAEKVRFTIGKREIDEKTPQTFWTRHLWGKKIGMVFQHADEALNLESKVREIFSGLPTWRNKTDQDLMKELSELFDITIDDTFLNKKVKFLSGGQKQRLNLLRTFSLKTDLIIFDEPLNGLDFESCQKVIALIREKIREGQAVLMISHNEEIFNALITDDHVYRLSTR